MGIVARRHFVRETRSDRLRGNLGDSKSCLSLLKLISGRLFVVLGQNFVPFDNAR